MTKLNKIKIEGFKSIKSEVFDLTSINVLIGANGSGKSNFIEAFNLLKSITDGRLSQYVKRVGGAQRLLHFGSKETNEIRLHVHFNDSVDQYEIALEATDLDELFPADEYTYYWKKSQFPQPYNEGLNPEGKEAGISAQNQKRVGAYVKAELKSWRVYHFHDVGSSSPLKKIADIDDNKYLRPDGSNLAAFLYLLREEHNETYETIRKTVRRMAPFFDDFILEPRALDEDQIRLEWQHTNSDRYFDVSSFSDGTLRFIALTTLLAQPNKLKPSVILLDEPELGLHPYAITLLGSLIQSASLDSQVIISTQSPYLLDQFEPEHVVVVERSDGSSTFRRLDKASLQEWLDEYSLGQLWEKNELGGRPTANS